MCTVGGEYSSSYFVYVNGVLAKRYFNFDIYETSDNRWELEETGSQKYFSLAMISILSSSSSMTCKSDSIIFPDVI